MHQFHVCLVVPTLKVMITYFSLVRSLTDYGSIYWRNAISYGLKVVGRRLLVGPPWLKAKSFQNLMRKLVLPTAVYCVWNEINRRIFTNTCIDAISLQKQVCSLVGSRLMCLTGVIKSQSNMWLQREWNLSQSIFRP